MKKAYVLDLNKNHFEDVSNLILPFYNQDPMNFLFIGPSGFYVKQVADHLAFKTKRTINRDSFLVINQYVTEMLKNYEPEALILNRDFLKIYIENEILDLIELEKKDTEFSEYLNIISKSQKSVEYILDIFEKKWEITRVQDEKALESSEEYKLLDTSIDYNSNLYKLYKKLEKRLEDILNTKFDTSIKYQRNYDPVSVYKWFYQVFPEILKNENKKYIGKRVVISGFFDISPAIHKTLKSILNLFEEVHFLTWINVEDRSFNSISKIYDFLKDEGFVFKTRKKTLKSLFEGKNISVYPIKDELNEIEIVTKEVKRKLLYEKITPDDLAIIVPNNSTAKLLSDYLAEAKIPFRFKNDIPLSESQIVLILLQPIKTLVNGCQVEDLLAMIESGYGGKMGLSIEQIENYLRSLNLFYDIQKSSLKNRKEKWINVIDNEIQKRNSQLKNTDEIERIEEELKDLIELKKAFENVFSILSKINERKNKKKDFTISDFKNMIKEWNEKYLFKEGILDKYKSITLIERELNALKTFENIIINIERTLEKILIKENSLGIEKFYKIISSLIQIETFRESESFDNTVEISTLEDSRFLKKKFKYFIGFTEDNYPSIRINPFLSSMSNEGISITKLSEEISRRNLFISVIFTENVIFSYPKSKVTGEPILPSPYEKEFRKNFQNINYSEKFVSKREILPKDPENIFSLNESKIYYVLNGKNKQLNDQNTVDIERMKKQIKDSKWTLSKKTNIGKLSHTKITIYVDCPFKYYLERESSLKGDKDFEKFFEGLIKHRVMKELFSKYKFYEEMSQKYQNEEELKEEIKSIVLDVWQEYTDDFLKTYEAVKEVESEKISEDIFFTIGSIIHDYFKIGKNMVLTYSQVIDTELEVNSKIDVGVFKDLYLNARIDRIDLLNGNYRYILDNFEDQLLPESYAIIDYKNSSSFQSEQLLLYYLAIINSKEWKNKLENNDTYLKFEVISEKNNNKFIKIQNDKIIYKKHGKRKEYVSFDIDEFYKWLGGIFESINDSDFTPIAFRERNIRRFFEEMHDKYESMKSQEKYYDCSSCQFRSLCELLQYKERFVLPSQKYKA